MNWFDREAMAARIEEVRPFIGFAPLFAWHFCFWFAPSALPFADLLSSGITDAWLAYLAASVVTLLGCAWGLGNRRRLPSSGLWYAAAPVALCVCSLLFSFEAVGSGGMFSIAVPVVLGVLESLCFLLWGERLSSLRYRGTSTAAVAIVGSAAAASFALCMVLPALAAPAFIAVLPLVSGLALVRENADRCAVVLKPRAMRRRAERNIAIVGAVSCVVSVACFFLLAVIPGRDLYGGEWSYGIGVLAGTAVIVALSCVRGAAAKKDDPFCFIPWLLVMVIVAFALFLGLRGAAGGFAFLFTALVYSSFEMLLMMYFVVVAQKGAATAAIALGASLGLFRLGVLAGDALALGAEGAGLQGSAAVDFAAAAFLCLVAVLLIPLMSEGRYMEELTAAPAEIGRAALERACDETAAEFSFSPREREVLELLVRGYAVDNIAEKLVISPHTVRAHVRHLYEKARMHKKSELVGYVKDQMAHYGD